MLIKGYYRLRHKLKVQDSIFTSSFYIRKWKYSLWTFEKVLNFLRKKSQFFFRIFFNNKFFQGKFRPLSNVRRKYFHFQKYKNSKWKLSLAPLKGDWYVWFPSSFSDLSFFAGLCCFVFQFVTTSFVLYFLFIHHAPKGSLNKILELELELGSAGLYCC